LKSYYQNDNHADNNDELSFSSAESLIESLIESSIESSVESIDESQSNLEHTDLIADSIVFIESIKRERDRSRKYSLSIAYFSFVFNTTVAISFVSSFIAFRQKEIVDLLEKEIFISINKRDVSTNVRIFSSRFVNEIKHSGTEKAFEKFRLVIQAFNDQNKILVLTQSSIIQRVNQRLIICRRHVFSINEAVFEKYYSDLRSIAINSEQRFLRSIILRADQTNENFI
jgi:hypothetical protein